MSDFAETPMGLDQVKGEIARDRERRFSTELEQKTPLATGRWGEIRASSPTGFTIKTKEVQGRLEVPEYPARENVVEANRREREFHQKQEDAKAGREGREPEKITIDDVAGTPKTVIRGFEMTKDGGDSHDVLELTISGNTYQGYRAMSGANAGEAERNQGMILGVAMGIVTSEGNIVVQKRGKNATYGDDVDADSGRGIPGASAAGTFDAQLASRTAIVDRADETGKQPGEIGIMIEPINTDDITRGMYREAEEEDGLKHDEISITPTLFIEDRINPHWEVGMTGSTSLTASEFLKRAIENQSVKRGRHDFSERVMVLSPQELEKLLTEVEVPWPPTHALTMIGTLQQAYIQQGMSPDLAEARMFEIQEKWFANNRRINERIRHYYDEDPDALTRNKQRASTVTDLGYDPRVFGKDQGVPPLDETMRAAGIGETTERVLQEASRTS